MRHLYLELLLSDHNSFCTPPCRDACPTHIKIPQFLDAIAHGDYKTGVRKLREDLPFPAILGRVCPRPCEGPCRRQLVDAADHHLLAASLHGRPVPRRRADRRAAAARRAQARQRQAHRRRRRRPRRPRLRLLRAARRPRTSRSSRRCPSRAACCATASPAYRLPRDVLDKELNVLWRMGVELQCDTRLGVDFQHRRPHGRLRRRLPGPRRLRLQRDGRPRRGRRRRCRRRSTSWASSSSPATCTWATRWRSSAAASPPWTPAAPPFAGAPTRSPAYAGAARKEMPAHRRPRSTRPSDEGVRLELLVAPVRVVLDDERQGVGHRDAAHASSVEPDASGRPPAGAGRGHRVRGRLRPGDRGHRPVPQARRHERGAGRQAHQAQDRRGRRVHLPDRRPAESSPAATWCWARRPSSRPSHRARRPPGASTRSCAALDMREVVARARRAARHAVLCRSERAAAISTPPSPAWPRSRRCSST